jgi:hypothetical protein
VIAYTAFASNSYILQVSTNLTTWIALQTNGPFTGPTNINQSISTQGRNRQFFRILLP